MRGKLKNVVPQVGFEPTRPKAEDFESTKSTSSITVAHSKILYISEIGMQLYSDVT